jgi:hypothetical protein
MFENTTSNYYPYMYTYYCGMCGRQIGCNEICYCQMSTQPSYMSYGWICPVCNKVHAPGVPNCDCHNIETK